MRDFDRHFYLACRERLPAGVFESAKGAAVTAMLAAGPGGRDFKHYFRHAAAHPLRPELLESLIRDATIRMLAADEHA